MTWKKNRRDCIICRDEYGKGKICADHQVDLGLIPTVNVYIPR